MTKMKIYTCTNNLNCLFVILQGYVNLEPLGKRGYHIPRTGTVQLVSSHSLKCLKLYLTDWKKSQNNELHFAMYHTKQPNYFVLLILDGLNRSLKFVPKKTKNFVVRVVDLESLVLHYCGFKSHQGLQILSCEKAIHLVYGTLVVLLVTRRA